MSRAVFNEESLQRLAATGGEQDHALFDAIKDGFAVAFDFCFAKGRAAFIGMFKHLEQVKLGSFLFSGGRDFAFVLAEQLVGTLPNGEQSCF